jgi:hypothetical protein
MQAMPGPGSLTRLDFQELAEARLREARQLLIVDEYSGAYYLAGYTVECALKACICRQYPGDTFPSKGRARGNIYIHDLDLLIHEAELTAAHRAVGAIDTAFANNWSVVLRWSEQTRYDRFQRQDALDLIDAVSNGTNGVLQWLRLFW